MFAGQTKLTESDLEILEAYLDGELPMSEAEGLWRRLAAEPALTAALDELRAQRSIRMSLWSNMEPTDVAATMLAKRVAVSVRRRNGWEHVYQAARWVTAAAACLLIGFQVGWFERGAGPGTTPTAQNGTIVASNGEPDGYASPVTDTSRSRPEATDLINDLNNWQAPAQAQQTQSRDLSNNVVPVSDEQF